MAGTHLRTVDCAYLGRAMATTIRRHHCLEPSPRPARQQHSHSEADFPQASPREATELADLFELSSNALQFDLVPGEGIEPPIDAYKATVIPIN